MVNREVAENILRYGQSRAVIGPDNLYSGFLTQEVRNKIDKEEALLLARESEYLVREFVKQLISLKTTPREEEVGQLYQYIFDKVAEATYKTIIGREVDTELDLKEVFEYHEPDLPYYIQQKINVALGGITSVYSDTMRFIKEKGYQTDDLEYWLLPLLILSSGLAMKFVLELDLNDDSELRQFIGEDR